MIRHSNLQYAESYVILHYQMMNVFITFLNVLKNFHVFNVLALFIFSIVYYISGAWCISAVYVQ